MTAPTTSRLIAAQLAAQGQPARTLAGVLGLSVQAVSRRMTGETDWTVGELLAVAGFLGVEPASLLPAVAAAA